MSNADDTYVPILSASAAFFVLISLTITIPTRDARSPPATRSIICALLITDSGVATTRSIAATIQPT